MREQCCSTFQMPLFHLFPEFSHDLDVGKEQTALVIFDKFRGQLTTNVIQALEDHNIQSVFVPAGCTDQLQPLDLTVNKIAKSFLRQEFQQWYADEIANQDQEKVELG